jgi:hypothetical protein
MRVLFENFRKFADSGDEIEQLVSKYYSDLTDEEQQEKSNFFKKRMTISVKNSGEWIRKTMLHSFEERMKIERERRERSPEDAAAAKASAEKSSLRSKEKSREMNKKYGRRWNK